MTDYKEQYSFIKTSTENNEVIERVELTFSAVQLDEICEQFMRFMRAGGFYFTSSSRIDVVDDNTYEVNDEEV